MSQEEYQFKFDLVNMDLQLKDLAEQNAKQYVVGSHSLPTFAVLSAFQGYYASRL